MSKKSERRGLGRGLSTLLADVNLGTEGNREAVAAAPAHPDRVVPIEKLVPNPDQPRQDFGKAELEDLSRSIAEKGIIQPLIVRTDPGNPAQFQIVAGERRWRAAQLAQLHEVPVLVRDLDDTEVLEIAIIENIQRADLNPVEEALGYRQLMDRFGHTQEKLAAALGKSRSHIANLLRLLTLPEEVLGYLREGKISAGHARAAITAQDPVALIRRIIQSNLSVRQAEVLAKQGSDKPKKPVKTKTKDANTAALEADLSAQLRMRVSILHQGHDGGELRIRYRDLDQLDSLCQLLTS